MTNATHLLDSSMGSITKKYIPKEIKKNKKLNNVDTLNSFHILFKPLFITKLN